MEEKFLDTLLDDYILAMYGQRFGLQDRLKSASDEDVITDIKRRIAEVELKISAIGELREDYESQKWSGSSFLKPYREFAKERFAEIEKEKERLKRIRYRTLSENRLINSGGGQPPFDKPFYKKVTYKVIPKGNQYVIVEGDIWNSERKVVSPLLSLDGCDAWFNAKAEELGK